MLFPDSFFIANEIAYALEWLVEATTKFLLLLPKAIQIVSLWNPVRNRNTQLSELAAFSLEIEGGWIES